MINAKLFKNSNCKGQTLVEYLLITVFLSVIFSFMFRFMGGYLKGAFYTAAGMILGAYS